MTTLKIYSTFLERRFRVSRWRYSLRIYDWTITNGSRSIWIKFNYTFTEPTASEIDYTQEGIKFKSNGTLILS